MVVEIVADRCDRLLVVEQPDDEAEVAAPLLDLHEQVVQPRLQADRDVVIVRLEPAARFRMVCVNVLPVQPNLDTVIRPDRENVAAGLSCADPAESVADDKLVWREDLVQRDQVALGAVAEPLVCSPAKGNLISLLRVDPDLAPRGSEQVGSQTPRSAGHAYSRSPSARHPTASARTATTRGSRCPRPGSRRPERQR